MMPRNKFDAGGWNKIFGKQKAEKMREALAQRNKERPMFEEENPQWKGEMVGYFAVHEWVILRKPKPSLCEHCNKKPPSDLANVSGKYKRDLDDYLWLCRSCHMIFDKRMDVRDEKGRFMSTVQTTA
jgi:hypothetical protein